jgi:hypothetical protein
MKSFSKKTRSAIQKYSVKTCREAFAFSKQGEGASTIGFYLNLTTNQADAAINAGREINESCE